MASSSSITWKVYDSEFNLSDILTEAARACVGARATNPGEFLCSYFTRMVSGDSADVLECFPVLSASGEMGMGVFLKLFTNAEAETTAVHIPVPPVPKPFPEGTVGSPTQEEASPKPNSKPASPASPEMMSNRDVITAIVKYMHDHILPQMQQIGVYQQAKWDEAIDHTRILSLTTSSCPEGIAVPHVVRYILSTAASIAAAKNMKQPLFKYQRALCTERNGGLQGGAGDSLALPQLLIPFFGYNTAHAPSSQPGSVCLHTVYILPAAHDYDEVERKGVFTQDTMIKIMEAVRAFGDKTHAHTRSDGAYIVENCENITDAVQTVADAMAVVGLEVGKDVSVGIRIACPVVRHSAAAVTAAAAKAKKSAVKVEENMYTLFPGEADITAAQLAEYVRSEISQCEGKVVFLEDTHDAQDEQGLCIMQNLLKQWEGIHSGNAMYSGTLDEEHGSRLTSGARRSLSENLTIVPPRVGTLSSLYTVCKHIDDAGRSCTLSCDTTAIPTRATVDLAFGVQSRFLNLGGLRDNACCDAISYYMMVMESLSSMRTVGERVPLNMYRIPNLPPYEETEPIPEIKRKTDKKRKKGGK